MAKSDGSLIFDTKIDLDGIKSGLTKIGALGVKMGAVAAGAAATATAAIGKMAISSYADFEQLVGGVETLFKESSKAVQENAKIAFKTAGMSANNYMETVTGFSASLLQSLAGDTEKAAAYADMAIIDMSDNANKMGTDMTAIVNAYQGFAKQNYTMLDNLKLGYGGTKTEMERLLVDAEKISGIKYDLSSYADIVAAIHVIQEEMGIAGTTALEAEETITGSFLAMKAAAQNLVAGFGNKDADIKQLTTELIDSFKTVAGNLEPVVAQIAQSVPQALEAIIGAAGEMISQLLPSLTPVFQSLLSSMLGLLPELSQTALSLLDVVVDTITENAPMVIEALAALGVGVLEFLPSLVDSFSQIITTLVDSMTADPSEMMAKGIEIITNLCDSIIAAVPVLGRAAIGLLVALAQGLAANLPTLIAEVPRIINEFASAIYDLLPMLLVAAGQIMWALGTGLIQAIPTLIKNLPQIFLAIVNVITLMNWASIGKNLISSIGKGISGAKNAIIQTAKDVMNGILESVRYLMSGGSVRMIGLNFISSIKGGITFAKDSIVAAVKLVASGVINGFKIIMHPSKLLSLGQDVILGIVKGLVQNAGLIVTKMKEIAQSALDSVKNFFGIKSPSKRMRDEVGKPIPQGIAVGIMAEQKTLNDAIIGMSEEALEKALKKAGNYEEIGKIYAETMSKGVKKHADISIKAVNSLVDESIKTLVAGNKKAKTEYVKAGKEVSKAYATAIKDGIAKVQEEISAEVQRITQEAQAQYDDIIAKKDDMERKLAGFGELFQIDQESGEAIINNLNNQIDAIKRYDEVLTNLKAKGASDEFMNEVTKLGVDEGMKFGEALLKLSDEQFKQYEANWQEKQKLAKEVAMKFYKDQLDALQSDFVNKLDKSLKSVPAIVQNIGVSAIQGMIQGMDGQKSGAVSKAREIADAVIAEMARALDINSPSRVAADLIGRNIPKGVMVGMDEEQRNLLNRIRGMVDLSKMELGAKVSASVNGASGTRVITNNNDNGVSQTIVINTPVKSPIEMMREAKRSAKELAYA